MPKREQWKSTTGFLFAAIGSAIGLGNIWRFSYMAYSNGGGAFLIPYLFALFTIGIPLLILEFAVGHERIGSSPYVFAKIGRKFEPMGWWMVIFAMFGIMFYYAVIIAWCVDFFFYSLHLSWGNDTNHFFFKQFLQLSSQPFQFGHIQMQILSGLVVVWVISWFFLYRGVQKGIEVANWIFMPILLGLTLIMVAWAVTLNGAHVGIAAYLTPNFQTLSHPRVWIDAFSQIFFTLTLAFGVMIAYASYLPRKSNITKFGIVTAVVNCSYSLLVGFAIFSILGFMSVSEHKPIADVITKSIGLAFVAIPEAFNLMPGGNIFGCIFFLCLMAAGLSSVSIMESLVSSLMDKFGWQRKPLVTIISAIGFLGGLVFTTQAGLYWIDIVDHFLTHYGLVIAGIFECIVLGWLLDLDALIKHVNSVSSIHIGKIWRGLIRYFVPLVLIIMLAMDIVTEIRTPYEAYSWVAIVLIGVNWLLVTAILAIIIARFKWRANAKPL